MSLSVRFLYFVEGFFLQKIFFLQAWVWQPVLAYFASIQASKNRNREDIAWSQNEFCGADRGAMDWGMFGFWRRPPFRHKVRLRAAAYLAMSCAQGSRCAARGGALLDSARSQIAVFARRMRLLIFTAKPPRFFLKRQENGLGGMATLAVKKRNFYPCSV